MILLKIMFFFGKKSTQICSSFGRSGIIIFNSLIGKSYFYKHFFLIKEQIYKIGTKSLLIIIISGFFIGMVITLQSYFILLVYSAENSIGMFVSLSLFRELGPVFTALLCSGRIGSSLTAEISTMKVTEQLDSMEMMGVDPLRRILSPRFWAGMISIPLLNLIFITSGIIGSAVIAISWKGINSNFFWLTIQNSTDLYTDITSCLIKSIIFAIVILWISLFNGYDAIPTAEGISKATTRTVVHSSLAIFCLDFILTTLMFGK